MTDREKVVSDLEEQIAWIRDNDFHKFPGWGHAVLAMRDAIALLKMQEPIEPVVINGQYECGECRYELRIDADSYCPCCGRMVKWE